MALLIAYATTYPDQVAGMVLLDSPVPADPIEVAPRFLPQGELPGPDDWMGTNEEMDEFAAFQQAYALEGKEPPIPVTYLASNELPDDPAFAAAILRVEREYAERYDPGRFIQLDAPHYMEVALPARIAEELERVIAAA